MKLLNNTSQIDLTFEKLDKNTEILVLITDAYFNNFKQLRIRLCFIILLVDKDNKKNIFHYGSQRCRRVTRSDMASELNSLILRFDYSFIVRYTIEVVLG